mgnify:CR=1 FL=1|tara:strand:- start:484 stop:1500 length:1017 start_codon:yes stop_codon:yes gene_type:complete
MGPQKRNFIPPLRVDGSGQAQLSEKENIVMKHSAGLLFSLVAALSVVGCNKLNELKQPGSKEVLGSYVDASLRNRSEEAYGYVSSEDKAAKSLSEYKAEITERQSPLAAVFAGDISFKVMEVTETGSTAIADVEITLPDMSGMFQGIMGAAFSSAFGGKDENEIEETLAKKYESENVPTTTKNEEFHLLREKDGWKVVLGWKAEKEVKEAEAMQERESLEEEQAYIKNIVLKNFKVSQIYNRYASLVTGVSGTIVNKGDKSLKRVVVTVYFLDKNDTAIGEEDFIPVRASGFSYSYGEDNKPLKPNYVKDFEYPVEHIAPSSWSKKATAKVTDIEFVE